MARCKRPLRIQGLYAIVPVKTLVRAKTRLSPVLSLTQRLKLARRFLDHALKVLAEHPGAARTIVVSADKTVLRLARVKGMIALPQTADGGINRAVALGCRAAKRHGATAILVVSTDLPLLTAAALRRFTRPASRPTIRIAADRHESGTNALYLQPARSCFARFGDDSLRRHREAAEHMRIAADIVYAEALAVDVDLPADLALATRRPRHACAKN